MAILQLRFAWRGNIDVPQGLYCTSECIRSHAQAYSVHTSLTEQIVAWSIRCGMKGGTREHCLQGRIAAYMGPPAEPVQQLIEAMPLRTALPGRRCTHGSVLSDIYFKSGFQNVANFSISIVCAQSQQHPTHTGNFGANILKPVCQNPPDLLIVCTRFVNYSTLEAV